MHRSFGIWLLTCPRSFEDPRIWREDRSSNLLQTSFQRKIGIRYVGSRTPRYPNANTGVGDFGMGRAPSSIAKLFAGHFHTGPVHPKNLWLRTNHRKVLARSTGYFLASSPRVRPVSFGGLAEFVGTLRARKSADA